MHLHKELNLQIKKHINKSFSYVKNCSNSFFKNKRKKNYSLINKENQKSNSLMDLKEYLSLEKENEVENIN